MKIEKYFFLILLSIKIFFFPTYYLHCNKFVFGVHGRTGFFSLFIGALNKIIWADNNNKIPVVYWGNQCIYFQANYNESNNAWEYYFEPISNLKYEKNDKIYNSFYAPDGYFINYCEYSPKDFINCKNCFNPNFHKHLKFYVNKIINKYIKIKPDIEKKIDAFFKNNMSNKFNIGIHLRGTDKKNDTKPVDPIKIFEKAKKIAKQYGTNYQFFIATDEERLLNLAKQHLEKVIFYNSHRSSTNNPIHLDNNIKNKATLGEEILIEAQLLSKCDFFIHTRSNVAACVMFFNPNIKNLFLGK